LLIYSLLTYGSNITGLASSDPPIDYRANRIKAIKEVAQLLKSFKMAKQEI
jgi:hypothetical protein